MSVTIGDITFDRVEFDAGADVLYLRVGDASTAVDFDETAEGHALRFDAEGNVVGVTLVRPSTCWKRKVDFASPCRCRATCPLAS